MVRILEKLQMRYLELLSERLEGLERDNYTQAVFDMRSRDVTEERLLGAEAIVWKVVETFEPLLLIGDQLTVGSILLASLLLEH